MQTHIDTWISILSEMVNAVNEITPESHIHQIYESLIEFSYIKDNKEDLLHLHLQILLKTLEQKILSYANLQGQNRIKILTNFSKFRVKMYEAQVDYFRSSILLLVTISSMRSYDLYKQDLENGRIGERILELFLCPPFLDSFRLKKDDVEIYLNGSLLTLNKGKEDRKLIGRFYATYNGQVFIVQLRTEKLKVKLS